jgi:Rha family phage regulatory protein
MNDLQFTNPKTLTLDSREIAEMIGKEHKELLRDIRKYENYLNESKIALVDFFEKSSYIDAKGETRPCYQITKKGCEFIAHKLTGQKGAIFTAKYINRFHAMEQAIQESKLLIAGASKELQAILMLDKKQQNFENRLVNLENNMTIDFGQQRNLQTIAQQKAIDQLGGKDTAAYQNKSLRTKVFSAIWKDYKDYFQVASYRDTLKTQYERAIEFLNDWRLTGKLLREVEECNNQLIMNLQEA